MKKFLPFIASGALALLGFLISHPLLVGICQKTYEFGGNVYCSDEAIEALGQPIFFLSICALIPSFFLMFLEKKAQASWIKFAVWWLPLSAVLIAITPSTSGAWMPIYFFGKEMITWFMGGLFTLISLILIALKTFRKPSK